MKKWFGLILCLGIANIVNAQEVAHRRRHTRNAPVNVRREKHGSMGEYMNEKMGTKNEKMGTSTGRLNTNVGAGSTKDPFYKPGRTSK